MGWSTLVLYLNDITAQCAWHRVWAWEQCHRLVLPEETAVTWPHHNHGALTYYTLTSRTTYRGRSRRRVQRSVGTDPTNTRRWPVNTGPQSKQHWVNVSSISPALNLSWVCCEVISHGGPPKLAVHWMLCNKADLSAAAPVIIIIILAPTR